jgi:hypothetical protein
MSAGALLTANMSYSRPDKARGAGDEDETRVDCWHCDYYCGCWDDVTECEEWDVDVVVEDVEEVDVLMSLYMPCLAFLILTTLHLNGKLIPMSASSLREGGGKEWYSRQQSR